MISKLQEGMQRNTQILKEPDSSPSVIKHSDQ